MMSSCSCREQSLRLNQQVNVMRKEIKNLRQQIDSAVRAHRKHMSSLQSELEIWSRGKPQKRPAAPDPQPGPEISLEKGCIQTVPIGYIDSCFSRKNGTPRQPAVCTVSRASLQIQPSVFNNPDHALTGLENYSHVWLIFLFHKNGHLSYKAKVKPPRLNGQKVGVYSTRSPHRPNAIGLTLAKLESITEWGRPKFQFLKGADEAEAAVRGILAADPRSVYRRTRCRDRLFFFTLDSAEITCWFGDGFVEVLRVRPVQTQEIPT
uniref:tRNA methyltransferase O n=1 Tax=Astyanax mexicanus TaxID=7994 RepID=A0A3B1K404_ASTMX